MKVYNLITVCILILLSKEVKPSTTSEEDSSSEETFLYFAYGSNLLAKRIHINNPSAKFFSIAKLSNFRLDFEQYENGDEYWNGADATIVEDSHSDVWGALWTFNIRDIPHLDEQEDVNHGTYQVRNVSVQTPGGKIFMARTYQMTVDPPKVPVKDLPPERRPSITYMKVILDGALESGLPMDYIRFLLTFPTNGKLASCDAQEQLGHPCNVEEST